MQSAWCWVAAGIEWSSPGLLTTETVWERILHYCCTLNITYSEVQPTGYSEGSVKTATGAIRYSEIYQWRNAYDDRQQMGGLIPGMIDAHLEWGSTLRTFH